MVPSSGMCYEKVETELITVQPIEAVNPGSSSSAQQTGVTLEKPVKAPLRAPSSSGAAFNDMRRWTKPPSYYEARSPTASSSSRVGGGGRRRWQVSMESPEAAAPELFSPSSSSNSSFGSRFGPPADSDILFGTGGSGSGIPRPCFCPVPRIPDVVRNISGE